MRGAAALSLGVAMVGSGAVLWSGSGQAGAAAPQQPAVSPLPPGAIQHVMVIDIENETETSTFGPDSPVTYLTHVLEPQGELLQNYYAVGHVSNDNYLAQVSGQAPNLESSSDCSAVVDGAFQSAYNDFTPGTLDPDQANYPGQVDGTGCVFPSGVQTIGGQLDTAYPQTPTSNWREYAEDMGNDPTRDGGTPDPLGGTDCAHPTQVDGTAVDHTGEAEGPNGNPAAQQVNSPTTDQYVDRHNPFIYFHSVIDDAATCGQDVVPLGTVHVGAGGAPDTYSGHLAQDLSTTATTPRFSFVSPNVCDDGHDSTCAGTNTDGTTAGGLAGVNAWLSHWMPLILGSPAYRSGNMLVMITADESSVSDTTAGDNEQPGPNSANPGYSPVLNTPIAAFGGKTYYQLLGVTGLTPNTPPPSGTMPGGGRIGALLLNPRWIRPGTVDTTGSYNHYSALRTFEDLLGITQGGADGRGHLGFASTASDFGSDVFVNDARSLQVPCTAPVGGPDGYALAASDGGVFTYGNLPFCGSTGSITLNQPVVGMALAKDGGGYWLVARDGGVFAFGDAAFRGSMGSQQLNQPIVGMAADRVTGGYWLVASDGGIFSFGTPFYGSEGGTPLNQPIVGMAATPDGGGYWLVARDGGVFAFGDAGFYGSEGGKPLNQPIVGMAATPDGGGYWLVARDGGVFAFGDAGFYGSEGGKPLNAPVVGIASTGTGAGYRLVASDGGIFSFGLPFLGSMGGTRLNAPMIGMAGA